MTDPVILIIAFVFGSVVGSFLNVCIHRLPQGVSIVSPASRCPQCLRRIPFYYNIPLVSYIVLLGRCAHCRAPLSLQYPLVEAMAGLFSAMLMRRWGVSPELFIYFAFASALIVVTFIDLELQIIPDVISLPGIAVGLAASFFLRSPGMVNSVIGMLLGGGVLFMIAAAYHFIAGAEGMGGGDIKLLAMIGAFLGWKGVLLTLFAGSFLGAAFGLLIMALEHRSSKHAIPFGPFLAAGALIYLFYGQELIGLYLERLSSLS